MLLLVTPHSSGHVPYDVLWTMLGDQAQCPDASRHALKHLYDQSDPYTDLIFHQPNTHFFGASVSRFVVDLNRERDQSGVNGVVKHTDFDLKPLYPPDFELGNALIEERLKRYWDPFHHELERVLYDHNIELLISGHAMSPVGPLVGPDAGQPRPALCLMTGGDAHGEALHELPGVSPAAARALQKAAVDHFAEVFGVAPEVPAEVALNDPWSLDELSFRYSRPDRKVRAPGFGLELNRSLYLGREGCGQPDPSRLALLRRAVTAFSQDALQIVRAYPLGAEG